MVNKNYKFQPIQYEILSNLFIPEYLEKILDENLINKLVDEALHITNNIDTNNLQNTTNRYSKWTPSGYIKAYDNIVDDQTPIEGAKVRARRWFIIKKDYTNSAGYFETGKFRRPVNYSIKWESWQYDIRSGSWGQAYYNGPKQRAPWNLTIDGGKSVRYATIHRAAFRYHQKNIGGLKRPNTWSRLKYCYYHREPWWGNYMGMNWGNWDCTGLFPDIQIFGKHAGEFIELNQVYSTTIHETGHASHIELMNGGEIQFLQVTKQIYESWAEAIEWYITKIEPKLSDSR